MKHDLLADMFSVIKNTEAIGRKECTTPASKVIQGVLKSMQKHKYMIRLLGRINNANVIKPRFSVPVSEFIRWEKRFLPADDIGILILTTSRGIMDQKEAAEKSTGGKLLGFVY